MGLLRSAVQSVVGYPQRPGSAHQRPAQRARYEDIRAVSERRLVRRLGRVDPLVMLSVSRTMRLFLDA